MARPSTYSKEVILKLCDLIATSSKGLRSICEENKELPSVSTIMNWLSDSSKEEFLEQYTRARVCQAEFMADEIIEIADDSSRDSVINEEGQKSFNSEFAARSRLRIDARKWKAAHLAPKKYGDKLDLTTKGEKINSPQIDLTKYSDEELRTIADLQSKGRISQEKSS